MGTTRAAAGLLFAARNQKSEAEPFLRWELGNSNKADPEVFDALARIYMETFRLEESAQVLERWMNDDPDDARPHLLRAEIDVRIKAPSETIIARFQEALKRDRSLARAGLGWRASFSRATAMPRQRRNMTPT